MSGGSYDTVVVRWASGEVTVGTPAEANNREAFIEDSSLTTAEQAMEYGAAWLTGKGSLVDQADVGLTGATAALVPFTGLGIGDAVRVANRADVVETARVHGVGFTGLRRSGVANWSITVGSASQERVVRAQQDLSRVAAGSMKGTFAGSAPSPAPSFGGIQSGALPLINLPVADAESFTIEEPANRTKPYRFPEAAAVIRFQCQAESLVPTNPLDDPGDWTYADSIFELWKITYSAGSPTDHLLDTFTWPGTARLQQFLCEHLFATDESYQLRTNTAGSHNLITIQPIASSAN